MKVAMFVGAGFSKAWGLPLANEIMDTQDILTKEFPGKWQAELIRRVVAVWNATYPMHKGVVDEFARMLQQPRSLPHNGNYGSKHHVYAKLGLPGRYELSFQEFTSFLALRLSSKHWEAGTSRETKWGTGDHIRKQRIIPKEYQVLLKVLGDMKLIGIITTNYDLVIEKLLGPTSSGRLSGFNYGKIGEPLMGRHAVSSRWTYGPITVSGKIPLLKLNGSLNWAVSPNGQVVKYIDSRPSRSRRYQVLLLPPGTGTRLDKLRPVWKRAEQVLRAIDVLIFCGYSIPDYDQAVRDLLKNSSDNLKKIVILDVAPKPIEYKLYNLLGKRRGSIDIYVGPGITSELSAHDIAPLMRSLL